MKKIILMLLAVAFLIGMTNCKTNVYINDDGKGGAIRTFRVDYYIFGYYKTGVESCHGENGKAVCETYTVNTEGAIQ